MQDLGNFGGTNSYAWGINNVGQVVGNVNDGGLAFVWDSTNGMQDLGTLGGGRGAEAINNIGQVVGYSYTSGLNVHAFLWDSTNGMQDLGTISGYGSVASGINDFGQVVGSLTTSGEEPQHSFVWDSTNGMRDLNDLIDSNSGWTLNSAKAINNKGQIVGYGNLNGQQRAFLLTPIAETNPKSVPEPGSVLGLLAFGALGANSLRKCQKKQ
jgi:probable HAF family extracellular repeat protein